MGRFTNIFKDSNEINEKNVVGFAAFVVMVLFAIADVATGAYGKELIISDTIFNAFVIIVLGTFGIDGVTKIFKKDNKQNTSS